MPMFNTMLPGGQEHGKVWQRAEVMLMVNILGSLWTKVHQFKSSYSLQAWDNVGEEGAGSWWAYTQWEVWLERTSSFSLSISPFPNHKDHSYTIFCLTTNLYMRNVKLIKKSAYTYMHKHIKTHAYTYFRH